jgi:hypothetical protein
MGLMHDSDEYGILRWPLKQIAQALGAPIKLIKELVDCGVLYGVEAGACEPMIYTPISGRVKGKPVALVPAQHGPIWYSPRMVRDEYVRNKKGESTRFASNKPSPEPSPKGGMGEGLGDTPSHRQGDGSTSSSSSSTSVPNGTSVDARQRFEMHESWSPDEMSLKTQLRMVGVDPDLITPDRIREFVAYWINRDVSDNQGGWCNRLVKHTKCQAVREAAIAPTPASGADWTAGGVDL